MWRNRQNPALKGPLQISIKFFWILAAFDQPFRGQFLRLNLGSRNRLLKSRQYLLQFKTSRQKLLVFEAGTGSRCFTSG